MSKTITLEVLAIISDDGKRCDDGCDFHPHWNNNIRCSLWRPVIKDGLRCPECLAAEKRIKNEKTYVKTLPQR